MTETWYDYIFFQEYILGLSLIIHEHQYFDANYGYFFSGGTWHKKLENPLIKSL